eukprot:TRINITY_DN6364_c0_g1_i3.p1 TRINITY_DN6364_c0_g1~~TRINITY_DN6364_c0_g1_i3.p1  ORF type:complete len:507 (+),score=104.64 TRINITY_DN6364_c0_g1_i3:164-1522(+)
MSPPRKGKKIQSSSSSEEELDKIPGTLMQETENSPFKSLSFAPLSPTRTPISVVYTTPNKQSQRAEIEEERKSDQLYADSPFSSPFKSAYSKSSPFGTPSFAVSEFPATKLSPVNTKHSSSPKNKQIVSDINDVLECAPPCIELIFIKPFWSKTIPRSWKELTNNWDSKVGSVAVRYAIGGEERVAYIKFVEGKKPTVSFSSPDAFFFESSCTSLEEGGIFTHNFVTIRLEADVISKEEILAMNHYFEGINERIEYKKISVEKCSLKSFFGSSISQLGSLATRLTVAEVISQGLKTAGVIKTISLTPKSLFLNVLQQQAHLRSKRKLHIITLQRLRSSPCPDLFSTFELDPTDDYCLFDGVISHFLYKNATQAADAAVVPGIKENSELATVVLKHKKPALIVGTNNTLYQVANNEGFLWVLLALFLYFFHPYIFFFSVIGLVLWSLVKETNQ